MFYWYCGYGVGVGENLETRARARSAIKHQRLCAPTERSSPEETYGAESIDGFCGDNCTRCHARRVEKDDVRMYKACWSSLIACALSRRCARASNAISRLAATV